MSIVFANRPGDLGSVPGRVIPKTQKMVLDASLLYTHHFKVQIKGKVDHPEKGVAPCPTTWCSSYLKESLLVTLDYGRQFDLGYKDWIDYQCYIAMKWLRETYIKCYEHLMYTQNIGISKHEKQSRLFSSGTKLFITFEFKGSSTWGERYTFFLF